MFWIELADIDLFLRYGIERLGNFSTGWIWVESKPTGFQGVRDLEEIDFQNGSLGQKILIRTNDSQAYTFSFALSKGAETFHTEINKLLDPAHSKDKQLSELEKIENKLLELKKLFDEGVIKEQDYEISRKELVDRL